VKQLLQTAQKEEELLSAIAAAVARVDKDEVFRLASELTRNVQPTKAPPRNSSDQPPIPRLLRKNCSDSAGSVFLES
jgi:hypothetical protein